MLQLNIKSSWLELWFEIMKKPESCLVHDPLIR